MSEIKLKWKNDTSETRVTAYWRGAREALERAINDAAREYPGALARDIRVVSGGSMTHSWRATLDSEGLEIVQEETVVRFEELRDGDLVRYPVPGLKYHTVHQKAFWLVPETGDPRKVPISSFANVEVWRDGKWRKVVE